MKHERQFKESDLVLCSIDVQRAHTLHLMQLANAGVQGAREVAELSLARYFERLYENV